MTEQLKKAETEIVVRYAETDQMGIAHHANYPVWFEIGRTDFSKMIGFPYSQTGMLYKSFTYHFKFVDAKCVSDHFIFIRRRA